MKCPCCGHEMNLDNHRKMELYMCYDCGYIEGLKTDALSASKATNYERLCSMNMNETIAFLSSSLNIDSKMLSTWMDSARIGA